LYEVGYVSGRGQAFRGRRACGAGQGEDCSPGLENWLALSNWITILNKFFICEIKYVNYVY
jgi:hypothetical protein